LCVFRAPLQLSKDRILELYLNEISAKTLWRYQAAAQTYFNTIEDSTLAQVAYPGAQAAGAVAVPPGRGL
jgi:membrane carboxypeptidase/penicillin-binding protein